MKAAAIPPRTSARRVTGIAVLAAALALAAATPSQAAGSDAPGEAGTTPRSGVWNFKVSLDDKPIGEHRFALTANGDARALQSDASFAVKLLGMTAYRYRHRATEQWRGNCLSGLQAETDDDGDKFTVNATADDNGLSVRTKGDKQELPGCVMSFAYWNPAIRAQAKLLNAQTGKLETVSVKPAGSDQVEVRGAMVHATRWRITGAENPIDVWYGADGKWVGLDSTVSGGRKLRYRLD